MQLSAKARLISIIVAVVFMFGALAGTGAYLIINHLNNAKATTQTDTSIDNIFNPNGTINTTAAVDLLEAVGFFDNRNDTGTYKAHQIRTRNNSSTYNGDATIIFPMGYYNGTDIYWQATYLYNNYLTIWMVKNYTNSDWNENSVTVNYTAYANSTIQNYLDNTLWSALTMGSGTLQSIFALPSNVGYQSTSTANTTYWYTTSSITISTYNNLASAVANSSYLWLPSAGETMNNQNASWTNNTTSYTGQWGLNSTDRSFSTRNYDGTGASYCWLRSGFSNLGSRAMLVDSSGSANDLYVFNSCGVRPAAHLSLSALEDAIPPQYTISVRSNNTSYGTVSISPSGGTYYQGTTLTVTATPASGYRFVRWERNGSRVSTSSSYTFTVSGSYTYTAIFEPATATISTAVSPTGTGTATGGGTYTINTTATLTATPITGYKFVQWERNGSQVSTSTTYRPTVTVNATYTAVFTPCTVFVSSNNNTWGTATYSRSQSGGIYSDQVTLTATANDGYRLDYWLINGVRNDTAGTVYTFTITQDTTAVAYFKRSNAFASATLGGEVRISGNDLGTGTTSTTVSYEAIPYTGYYLIGWYVGDMLYTENSTTYTGKTLTLPRATAEGVAVVPIFNTNSSATPSLSFDLDNNTAITASIGGEARIIGDTYTTADTVTLIATVQTQNYRFIGWYIDGIQVSTDETAMLSRATVLGKIVQARFAPIDDSTTNDDTDNNQTGDFVFL